MTFLYSWLNHLSMYRLVLYCLLLIWISSIILSATEVLSYDPLALAATGLTLFTVTNTTNLIISLLLKAKVNLESASITGLILTLIVGPVNFQTQWTFLLVIGALAMASKYILAIHQRHIFNPAAVAVLVTGLVLGEGASWWVGNQVLFPIVVIVGLLIAAQTRRWPLIGGFLLVYLGNLILRQSFNLEALTFSPIWFFTFIMLTEPRTSPVGWRWQAGFGAFVALTMIVLRQIIPGYSLGLETALLIGNLVSFIIQPVSNFSLTLQHKKQIVPGIWSFTFTSDKPVVFKAGQYLEVTLQHLNFDLKGFRRYFSIASSPSNSEIVITTRIDQKPSSFKQALLDLSPGQSVEAAGPQGEFVLPAKQHQPIALIAGGIGITPVKSMMSQTEGTNQDVIVIYCNNGKEVAFKDEFDKAKSGVKIKYVDTSKGYLTVDKVAELVPDYTHRYFYISGSPVMVASTRKLLRQMGVKRIKTDLFIGYTKPV